MNINNFVEKRVNRWITARDVSHIGHDIWKIHSLIFLWLWVWPDTFPLAPIATRYVSTPEIWLNIVLNSHQLRLRFFSYPSISCPVNLFINCYLYEFPALCLLLLPGFAWVRQIFLVGQIINSHKNDKSFHSATGGLSFAFTILYLFL